MKQSNQKVWRWLIPILMLAAAAVVWAVLPPESGPPGGSRPTPLPTGSVQTAPTAPEAPPGAQTAPAQTETAPQPTGPGPEQTQPAADSPGTVTRPVQTEPVKLSGADDLQCREFSRFSGQFVEDGRDEPVEHVAAMLVTNRSDQYLDLATLTYDVGGYEATFIVTGLPAGRSAWVMEAQRLVIPDDAVFQLIDCVTAFRSDVTVDTDAVSLYAEANMLTAVNNTDETLEDVFVYYKTLHTDGNFFGGITYRVDFGDLEPGASAQTLAGHYRSGGTEIVRVGWAGQ